MNCSLLFLLVTVFLDMLALGLAAPALPQLVSALTHGNSAHVATVLGVFGTAFALMQFLFSPVLGGLSDRFGRRPVILLSNFGLALDYILMALAPSIGWLMCGRVLAGITSASMTAANAYIADRPDTGQRAKEFGFIGVACALGFIVGPGVGGLLGKIDLRLPFWFAASLSCCNGICVLFMLPESLRPDRRRKVSWKEMNLLGNFRIFRAKPQLVRLCFVAFLNAVAGVVLSSIYVLYVADRYGWDARSAGFSLMLLGVCSVLALGTLVKPAIAGLGERGTVVLALLCGAAGMAVFGWAGSGNVFLLGIPLIAIWSLGPAAAQSFMTRGVATSEQGELQGTLTSLSGVAALIGPSLFTLIYTRSCLVPSCSGGTIWTMPGTAWLVSAAILFGASALMVGVAELPVVSMSSTNGTGSACVSAGGEID